MAEQVALFVTCLVENMRPKIGFDTIALLEDAGFNVVVPSGQVCCGQPNYNSGDQAGAIQTAKFVIDTFLPFAYTVAPSGSCAGMLKHHYPQLLEGDGEYRTKAKQLAEQVYEVSQLLQEVNYQPKPVAARETTYHDSCAGLRELGIKSGPRELLSQAGVTITELKDAETCCGFGGTFCVKYPDVSGAMLDRKLDDIAATGSTNVTLGDLGCILNIEGGAQRQNRGLGVKHFVEVLAEGLTEGLTEGLGSGGTDEG